jgi:hypothetical protein
MWTISNSRAEAAILLFVLMAGCTSATEPSGTNAAPDAPQPAIQAVASRPPYVPRNYTRIELASARTRKIDSELVKLAGPQFLKDARDPIAVEATTTSELPLPIGDSSPVLIINGQLYPDTWFLRPNRLVAFVADRATLRAENRVEAMWLGAGEGTRSEKPIILKPGAD